MLDILDSISVRFEGQSLSGRRIHFKHILLINFLSIGLFVLVTFWLQWLSKNQPTSRNKYVVNVTYLAVLNVLQHRRQQLLNFSPAEDVVARFIALLAQGLKSILEKEKRVTRLRCYRLAIETGNSCAEGRLFNK